MSSRTTIAKLSGVDFQVASNTPLGEGGTAVRDGVTVASITGGLLTYMPSHCSVIAIANGTVINAIRQGYLDGSIYTAPDIEADQGATAFRPLLLRAADGGVFTLAHDAAPPVAEWELYERIIGQYAANVLVGAAWAYVQWESVGGSRRWRAADWSAYIPSDPTDWSGAPTRLALWTALDSIAAEVATLKGGPITVL